MTPICDFCRGEIGDHDKPFVFSRSEPEAARKLMLRVTESEFRRLDLLRMHVLDVRDGNDVGGPADGDIAPDRKTDATT